MEGRAKTPALLIFFIFLLFSIQPHTAKAAIIAPTNFGIVEENACYLRITWDGQPGYRYNARINGKDADQGFYVEYILMHFDDKGMGYPPGSYRVEVQAYDGNPRQYSAWSYIDFVVNSDCTYQITDTGGGDPSDPPPTGGDDDKTPPPTPTNLQKIDQGSGWVQMRWDEVSGAYGYNLYIDGVKYNNTPITTTNTIISGLTDWVEYWVTVTAVDAAGNESPPSPPTLAVSGITDTGGGDGNGDGNGDGGTGNNPPACTVCDQIAQLLECPDWEAYMAEWTDAIRAAIPPPPNWHQVAGIMRDTIVPAMGQELVQRMPELSRILADELQRREKPVGDLPELPTFNPSTPEMTDLTAPIDSDFTTDVPDFTPDYSGSRPFTIPDPADWSPDDTDIGYTMPTNQDLTAPEYNPINDTGYIEPDIGYKPIIVPEVTAPEYTIGTGSEQPMPDYDYPAADPAPDYTIGNGNDPIPAPIYTLPDDPMPDYRIITD